jgi:hypothetical protein
MLDYLVPLAITLLGLVGLVIYILAISLRDVTQRMMKMNEQLLIVAGVKQGGESVGRALAAMAKPPKKDLPKEVEPKETPKKGLTLTVGGR